MSQTQTLQRKRYTKAEIKEMRKSILLDKNKTIKQIAAEFAKKYNRPALAVEQKIYALFKHSKKRTDKNPTDVAKTEMIVETSTPTVATNVMTIVLPNGTYTGAATRVEMQEDNIRIYF